MDVFDADLKLLRRIQELDTVLGPGTVIDLDGGAVRLDAEPITFDVQTSDDLPGLSPALRVFVIVRDHLAQRCVAIACVRSSSWNGRVSRGSSSVAVAARPGAPQIAVKITSVPSH